MGFFQVGLEVTRLPKETNLFTPMFVDKMKTNDMANTSDSTAGIRVGIGSSLFQVAGSVCSSHFAMSSMVSGIYVIATSRLAYGIAVRSTLSGSLLTSRPIVALMGMMMVGTFAATVLPKPNNDRFDSSGATGVANSKSP